MEKVKSLETKVETLQGQSFIMDNCVIYIKKPNNANIQYQCGINIEIHGIPDEINDMLLGKTAISILN